MSRNLLNLALLAGIVILAAIAFYEPGLEPVETNPAISSLKSTDVAEIRIRRPNQADLKLNKQNGQWQTSFNSQTLPANDWRIQQLLPLVEAESLARFAVDPDRLGSYQLDEPRASIQFDGLHIDFGGSEPLQRRRYIRIGEMIHLIQDRYYTQLIAADTDYLSSRLLPAGAEIRALNLPGLRIHQQAGNWQVEPSQTISQDIINRLIDEWRFAQAMQVTTQVAQNPAETISMQLSTGEKLQFSQTTRDDEWILTRPALGLSFHFPLSAQQRMTSLDETSP